VGRVRISVRRRGLNDSRRRARRVVREEFALVIRISIGEQIVLARLLDELLDVVVPLLGELGDMLDRIQTLVLVLLGGVGKGVALVLGLLEQLVLLLGKILLVRLQSDGLQEPTPFQHLAALRRDGTISGGSNRVDSGSSGVGGSVVVVVVLVVGVVAKVTFMRVVMVVVFTTSGEGVTSNEVLDIALVELTPLQGRGNRASIDWGKRGTGDRPTNNRSSGQGSNRLGKSVVVVVVGGVVVRVGVHRAGSSVQCTSVLMGVMDMRVAVGMRLLWGLDNRGLLKTASGGLKGSVSLSESRSVHGGSLCGGTGHGHRHGRNRRGSGKEGDEGKSKFGRHVDVDKSLQGDSR
jgi:hypothetical protein